MENSEEKLRAGKGRFIFWVVLFVLFITVVAACVGVWIYHAVLRHAMNELYDEVRVVVGTLPSIGNPDPDTLKESSALQIPDDDDAENSEKTEGNDALPLVWINFELLHQTSGDVYAWIEIPGTEVAFPIVQHPTNNSYYLRRAINGSYDITGCIYTQNYNSRDFSDRNTVIYGHYMTDGTKFGPLLSYMDAEFFEKHRRIDIYTETEWLTYEVFAAIPFNTRHILKSYKAVADEHAEFLKDVYSVRDARAIVKDDVEIDPQKDRIITLSTCLKTDTKRYLVLAKLVKSQLCE